MTTLEAIRTRRSVRKFDTKPVPSNAVEQILRAAMQAPSAGNQQPWQFVVVDDTAILRKIPAIHPHAAMCDHAPLGILVCGDTSVEKYPGYWVQDCSAAIQNMLLAVHDLGLGAVWTGLYPNEDRVGPFRELFVLPESTIPLALIVIGHPAAQPEPADRYRSDRVRYNRW